MYAYMYMYVQEACTSQYSHFACSQSRPWYIASATPKPKDVVLVIKNNIFASDDVRNVLFKAADIALRSLNPKDRVSYMYIVLVHVCSCIFTCIYSMCRVNEYSIVNVL